MGAWLDAIGLRRLDQTVEISTGIGTGDGVAEEVIFAANDERPDRVLGQVFVDPEASILDVDDELRPLLVGVVQSRQKCRFRPSFSSGNA